jgi:hypothetical protein
LYHLTPNDYEEFVSVIVHAKRAFQWMIEGPSAFQQLLSSIKRFVSSFSLDRHLRNCGKVRPSSRPLTIGPEFVAGLGQTSEAGS